ncbi:MAG: NADH-quinone oxidoreductase subunit C [Chloroflexi bacterium]|nr:NADH-quinone oxidoreductase subunit C [Chloroflexota bacterium]
MLDNQQSLTLARELLQPWAISESTPAAERLDVEISAENLVPAVQALHQAGWGYLSAITGIDRSSDNPEEEGRIEVMYHFSWGGVVTTLRLFVPYANAVIGSVCHEIPSATLYEREMIEMYGIEFPGTPSTEHLLLPDDWPAGVYPMRKSFTGLDTPTAG